MSGQKYRTTTNPHKHRHSSIRAGRPHSQSAITLSVNTHRHSEINSMSSLIALLFQRHVVTMYLSLPWFYFTHVTMEHQCTHCHTWCFRLQQIQLRGTQPKHLHQSVFRTELWSVTSCTHVGLVYWTSLLTLVRVRFLLFFPTQVIMKLIYACTFNPGKTCRTELTTE